MVPALLAVLLTATALIAGPASASAARLRVVGQDANVKYNCQWTVSSVNTVNNTVTGKISGNAFPATLAGYGTVVFNHIICVVSGSNPATSGALDVEANKASVSGSITVTLTRTSSYTLCGAAEYTLRDGTDAAVPTTCQSG
jgi:hypothetical protein